MNRTAKAFLEAFNTLDRSEKEQVLLLLNTQNVIVYVGDLGEYSIASKVFSVTPNGIGFQINLDLARLADLRDDGFFATALAQTE